MDLHEQIEILLAAKNGNLIRSRRHGTKTWEKVHSRNNFYPYNFWANNFSYNKSNYIYSDCTMEHY